MEESNITLKGFEEVRNISSEYIKEATTALETLFNGGNLKNEDIPVVIAQTIQGSFSEARSTYETLLKSKLFWEEHKAKIYRNYGVEIEEDGTVTLTIGADSLMHHQIEESKKRLAKTETEIDIAKESHIAKLYREQGIEIEEDGTVTLTIGADSLMHHQIELLKKQTSKTGKDQEFVETQIDELKESVIDNRIIKTGESYSDFIMALGGAGVVPNETLITNYLILTKLGLLRTGVHIAEDGKVTAQVADYNGTKHIIDLANYSLSNAAEETE